MNDNTTNLQEERGSLKVYTEVDDEGRRKLLGAELPQQCLLGRFYGVVDGRRRGASVSYTFELFRGDLGGCQGTIPHKLHIMRTSQSIKVIVVVRRVNVQIE
jgi:hypothetical protein